jgi:hypothetical protein
MLDIKIESQPNDVTCGPTSLQAVYRYYGDPISLEQVISEVKYVEGGGTLAVLLGCHALQRGYQATIHTCNLAMFDPSWFDKHQKINLIDKLNAQKRIKTGRRFVRTTNAYIEFLTLGGQLKFDEFSPSTFSKYFRRQVPILTGLSATYLYRSKREVAETDHTSHFDDLAGEPTGHFVVLCGYDEVSHNVVVADPYDENPVARENYYTVKANRLINAIMLGILTYDANFLVVETIPKEH